MGAPPERLRWAAEIAAAAVAQADPTDYAGGLKRLEETLEYLVWHAREATAPFDLARVFHPDEFVCYSKFRWDEEALGIPPRYSPSPGGTQTAHPTAVAQR